MKTPSISRALVVSLSLMLALPLLAVSASGGQQSNQTSQADSHRMQVVPGTKLKVRGVILKREDNNTFIVRDAMLGSEVPVRIAGNTKIEEKKGNPFRGAKKYGQAQLIRGLNVEVEGRGDSSGTLIADKIKLTDDDLRVALTVNSQVVPIEARLGTTEERLTKTEQNAERLSGQVEELGQVANLAKGGAAAAQETADAAVEGVTRTNDRISSLDDYEVKQTTSVNFRVGSALLSEDAKSALDEVAAQAKAQRGFVIEVRGFASSDGSERLNRTLSQRRADAVVRYLAEEHDIPLRRIVLPFGYGEAQPIADNSTLEGRRENRRVEVKMLISRGLTTPVTVNRAVSSNQ
jgi:outer membrane protein OmpA-like peptidoglycan-associated protein